MFVLAILILGCLFDSLRSGSSFCSWTVFRKHHVEGLMQSLLFLILNELENGSVLAALGFYSRRSGALLLSFQGRVFIIQVVKTDEGNPPRFLSWVKLLLGAGIGSKRRNTALAPT